MPSNATLVSAGSATARFENLFNNEVIIVNKKPLTFVSGFFYYESRVGYIVCVGHLDQSFDCQQLLRPDCQLTTTFA